MLVSYQLCCFRYDGDCDIDLSVGVVSAGIRDIKLRGLLRIELKPIIDTMPLVGAVSFGFVKDPVSLFFFNNVGAIFKSFLLTTPFENV